MKTQLTLLAAISLTACQTATPALDPEINTEWGKAVRHNIAAQAIPATAEEKAKRYIPADPQRRARTKEEYRTGTLPEPRPIRTGE